MAKSTKPNILVIWGDDIGIWNLSCYHRGMMGGRTPNIDRIAAEGAIFTDCYGQQSCTAGRAAFITGQHPFRTGLLKVGLPGAELGLRPEGPTIADLLKNHGYMTGQFGKNHLGDRNEYLPTVHGFDEFFGNLYHLNAEEEPEDPQYPKDPKFKQRFGPRGALRCKATDVDDSTIDPRFGKVGKQTIEDTGPITRKRMETVDEEFLAGSLDFMERAVKAGKPFFVWHNSTRMHCWTRLSPKYENSTGYGLYADGMKQLDDLVGDLLAKLEDLGASISVVTKQQMEDFAKLRAVPLDNAVPPALIFDPAPGSGSPAAPRSALEIPLDEEPDEPESWDDLAFAPVTELAARLHSRLFSSVEITHVYLDRIRRYDGMLSVAVSVLEERALRQAEKADRETAAGRYRGPLHGVPFGLKDLFSVPGTRTTWGAGIFRDQRRGEKATVAARLEEAGAVLLVKTSVGELAWGDVWFGGTTKNPWKTDQGSSGSSAGSASATAAGLVGFAIGTENRTEQAVAIGVASFATTVEDTNPEQLPFERGQPVRRQQFHFQRGVQGGDQHQGMRPLRQRVKHAGYESGQTEAGDGEAWIHVHAPACSMTSGWRRTMPAVPNQ